MINPMRVLIAGSGYVGSRLATHLRAKPGTDVWTLRRHATAETPYDLSGDLTRPDTIALPPDLTHVVFCAGLRKAVPAAYQALFETGLSQWLPRLASHPVQRVVFTSTTGVYEESEGQWIDESSSTQPVRKPAQYYLRAEHLIRQAPFPSVVARLSGIYGPGRTRLLQSVVDNTARRYAGPIRYLNHIHVEDIVGALTWLMTIPTPDPVYNVTDREPVDRNEALAWIAEHTGRLPPPWAPEDARNPGGRGGNKRCSNRRLLESGYRFIFPTFREGYNALLPPLDSLQG